MAIPVLMPKQGMTVESCFLSEWHVKENDEVKIGTLLFNYETDKAVFEYLSEAEGVILKILYQQGEIVNVLEPVCYVGQLGEKIDYIDLPFNEDKVHKTEMSKEVEALIEEKSVIVKQNTKNNYASPRAKIKARKQNLDLTQLMGTGPEGRILERDVSSLKIIEKNSKITSIEDDFIIKPISNMRKIIGKAMMNSLQNTAQLTHTLSFDATDMLHYRKKLKELERDQSIPKITLNDMIIYAVSRVLKNHKDLNAHFVDSQLKIFNHMHIGIATDTKRGLMVPTLLDADTLSLSKISEQAKLLISQCIAGQINPDLLTGASFTISNLGTLDIEHFTPIINPPQTGILGVNTIMTQVKKDDFGRYLFYEAMGLSLTYDHQVIDGAGASRFLKDLKEYLQTFSKQIESDSNGLI